MQKKLACADFTFPLLSHEKSLALAGLLEFEGVDIGLFEGRSHLWPSKEFKDLKGSARKLARKAGDQGLKIADVFLQMDPTFTPFAINHPDARRRRKARDWFAKTVEYAVECGSPHVTTLPGTPFEGESRAVSLARSVDELAWRLDVAQRAGVIFSVEAHVGSIVPKPEWAADLVKKVPGLTLTLDYTHFTRLGMPDSRVEPLLPLASHFHVRGARKGRLQTKIQDNTIDYKRVVQQMAKVGYKGYIGIEYVWIDWEHCNETDNVSETIQFRDLIRAIKV